MMRTLVIFTQERDNLFEAFDGETLEDLRDQIVHWDPPEETISEGELVTLAARIFDVDPSCVTVE